MNERAHFTDRLLLVPSREVEDVLREADRVCRVAWLEWFFRDDRGEKKEGGS